MMTIRKSEDRGGADFGWLKAKHTFSFGEYYDRAHMAFRTLRVINEDRVAAQQGFPTHGHRDMEIITYVISGALEHKDSMGNGSIIRPGDLQYMSAGTGVRHSEFNHSSKELVHLLQIWIIPDRANYEPAYDQKAFSIEQRTNQLKLVVSGDTNLAKEQNAILVRQDLNLYASLLSANKSVEHQISEGRGAWIQLVRGELHVNGQILQAGDGAQLEKESLLKITAQQDSEFLLFDLK